MFGYLNHIPGISPNSHQSDLPVLLPYQGYSAGKPEDLRFSRWLASSSPWMNWYAILTMATPLVSLLGVQEIVTLSRQAMEAEDNHPELLIPFFGFALLIFFAYCYPIARWTLKLEERYSVKL